MEVPNEGKFSISTACSIYEVNYPSSMDSLYAGDNGYNFHFSGGRIFEIVVNHLPRRILIKRWCHVTLEKFLAIMTEAFKFL